MIKTMNATQVAEVLFVNPETVTNLAARNEIRSVKIGRAWVFRESDVEEFLDRRIKERDMGVGR